MPYDYDAVIALFNSGAYNSQRKSADELVNEYYSNHLEAGSTISELAQSVQKQLDVLSKLSTRLHTLKDAKGYISKIEADNDYWKEALKKEESAAEELTRTEEQLKALDDRIEDIKKERNDLEERENRPEEEANFDRIKDRIEELIEEQNQDIPVLKGVANEEVRKKKEALEDAHTQSETAHSAATSSEYLFYTTTGIDYKEAGIASDDYIRQLEIAEADTRDYLEATQSSFMTLTSQLTNLLQTMPHTDPNYTRLAGTIEFWMTVSTAFSGIFAYDDKQQEARKTVSNLKELERIRGLDALNENRPPVDDALSLQTKEKLKEIRDYEIAPEDAAAEIARLDEEESRLKASLDNGLKNVSLMAKYPYLRNGSVEQIAELLYTPSRERGTGLFETAEEYRQRFADERTKAAAILMMDEEGITTPGFTEFITEMMKLDMEEPEKGQKEFEKLYREKGFSVIHRNVNGTVKEVQTDPKEIIGLIKNREPSKTELDNDVRTSVEKDQAELQLFNNNKGAIAEALDLKMVQLKKAALVQKYPDATMPTLDQRAEKRQFVKGQLQGRLEMIRGQLDQDIAQSTFWDTKEYKNFYNALTAAIDGTGDLTNLRNMADTYITAKGDNPRTTYGKVRLSCAKLVKGYLDCAAGITEGKEALAQKGEQDFSALKRMSVDQFLALRKTQEEMDILLSSPDTPLSDQQKDKAVKNVMLLLKEKMNKQPVKDAPTEEQIQKSLFPEGKDVTKEMLKRALQKTPEQIKDTCKEVVASENALERMRTYSYYLLRKSRVEPEEIRDAIAKLIVTAAADRKAGPPPKLDDLDKQSKQLQQEPDFKNFCTDDKLQSMRQEVLRHTDSRAAAALLLYNLSLSRNPVQPVHTQTERVNQRVNQVPRDSVAITKENAERAQTIRLQRRFAQGYTGSGHGEQSVGPGVMKKSELTVAYFDRFANYQQKSQIPENRLSDGKFEGYIAIGDPHTDAMNIHSELGRPNFVSRFIKGACEASDEWYQDAYDNIMDLYYKNMTGNMEKDRTAFYSDFRDTYLIHKNGGMGELIGDDGNLTAAGGTLLHDMINGVNDYGATVGKTCTLLGIEVPKTRGELEDLQKTLIEKKFENLAQRKTIRPEYGQAINDLLNDPECTLDQRNFLISVDAPTLQKLSQKNASVETFMAELNNAEDSYYETLEKELTENMAKGDDYVTFNQGSNNLSGSVPIRPSLSSGIRLSVRPSVQSARTSVRNSMVPGRASVRDSVMPGRGVNGRQSVMDAIQEEEPEENARKSDAPQLGR